ncbi:hypothetical protein BY996DRAFT_7254726 [Phakopsora pachyrhizi]|nr:hypothetical protein BY996DRAFT_7254726 [Phakopsora pachyrhizi]
MSGLENSESESDDPIDILSHSRLSKRPQQTLSKKPADAQTLSSLQSASSSVKSNNQRSSFSKKCHLKDTLLKFLLVNVLICAYVLNLKTQTSRRLDGKTVNPPIQESPAIQNHLEKKNNQQDEFLSLINKNLGRLDLNVDNGEFDQRKDQLRDGRNFQKILLTSKDQLKSVQESIFSNKQVIRQLPGARCEKVDLERLLPTRWLNDEIINFYGVMINRRSKAYSDKIGLIDTTTNRINGPSDGIWSAVSRRNGFAYKRVHCFSSFFYEKYSSDGFEGVKRWTKNIDLFLLDMIFFPINLNNSHWSLGVINIRSKKFEYYDSLYRSDGFEILSKLRSYLVEEHMQKRKKQLDLKDWSNYKHPRVPKQENSFDCGVFLCQFMESLSKFRIKSSPFEGKKGDVELLEQGNDDQESVSRNDDIYISKEKGGKYGNDDVEFEFDQSQIDDIRQKILFEIYNTEIYT